ncbi:MAG: cation-translocating P-type ATPase [Anaerolineae bacterium]
MAVRVTTPTQISAERGVEQAWYQMSAGQALRTLGTSESGLTAAQAEERLAQVGPNELQDRGAKPPAAILWEQVTSVMVLILIGAAVLSLVLGKYFEAGAIFAVVILFAILGFIQEYRAERAIAALKKLAVPDVRVRRDGAVVQTPARDLAPGDIVLLEAGNIVPADLRLLESANLRIQEAALTGESEPVEKVIESIALPDVGLGDRRNMAYMGTVVAYGRGVGVVVATGMQTELGKVAGLIQDVPSEMTPLQHRLDTVGKQLAVAGIVVALLIMVIGLVSGETFSEVILTAIGVAVAVIPEGLPAVVTFTLALGAQRMLRRNALIRKLPAVETLGSVTVICSDKTGTLTENRMTVTVVDVAGHRLDLIEPLRGKNPAINPQDSHLDLADTPMPIPVLLAAGALANDAFISPESESGQLHTVGDPTEGALLIAAMRGGLTKEGLEAAMPRLAELPFDSERKRMTTIHARPTDALPAPLLAVWGPGGYAPDAPYIGVTKGAVDGLLDLTTGVWEGQAVAPLDAALRQRVLAANEVMARDGMRVLGVAFRPLAEATADEGVEADLVLLGLVGMIDPPRPEVRDAVQTCRAAGIRPVMITGDHPLTASYIARDLGITRNERVLTGADLTRMSDDDLARAVDDVSVFARVSPEHKLRIVGALQKKGNIVAMTGDGVNDAPALKRADIGVAMGITGTDVSKEAADMVLRDDNFATIVAAVEEGRVIYDNLRRFLQFATAGNLGKILIMLLWPVPFLLAGVKVVDPTALLPLQLLWLNLMTDGILGMSMGFEKAESGVMRRPPHNPSSGIFSGGVGVQVLWIGTLIGVLGLGVGFLYAQAGLPQWQTMIFISIVFMQIFQALGTRSSLQSLFQIGIFSNRIMWLAIVIVLGLTLGVMAIPAIGLVLLGLTPLTAQDYALAVALGLVVFVAIEIEKAIRRWRKGREQASGERAYSIG